MMRRLLREVLLGLLGALMLLLGVWIYRAQIAGRGGAPGLPEEVEAPLRELDRLDVQSLDRRWILGAIGVLLTVAGWLYVLARRDGRAAPAGSSAARLARVARTRSPWLAAILVVGGCAAAIVAMLHAPEEVRVTDSLVLRRMPREEFLRHLAWGGALLGGAHLVLFLLLALLGLRRR